jgi:hypothetical protein
MSDMTAFYPVDDKYKAKLEALEAENAKLREALEFYSQADNYEFNLVTGMNYIWNDQGRAARQALEQNKNVKE